MSYIYNSEHCVINKRTLYVIERTYKLYKKIQNTRIANKKVLNIQKVQYAQLDSNQWGKSAADLQSDAFDHSAMCAITQNKTL